MTIPMPLYARLAQYLLCAAMASMAAWCAWRFMSDTNNVMMLVFFIWLCAAIVGLYRRVAWGRFYVSCVSVVTACVLALKMIPADYSGRHQSIVHELILFSPALAWLAVVVSAILVLMPALLIGIRKDWFRSAWW
jgi:hypothetical protein